MSFGVFELRRLLVRQWTRRPGRALATMVWSLMAMNIGSMIEGKTVKKSRLVLGAISGGGASLGVTSEPAPLVTSGLSGGNQESPRRADTRKT